MSEYSQRGVAETIAHRKIEAKVLQYKAYDIMYS